MSEHQPLDERYFTWLYSQIALESNRNPARSFWLLCEQLHKTPFEYFVANDHNRAWDGRALREEFMDLEGLDYDLDWMDLDCSFLEMFIALSRRASYQTGMEPYEWFWHILKNLELHKYTDEKYHDGIRLGIAVVLDGINRRTYEPSGRGGLFPLKHASEDQREVEIWYQMAAYLLENHMTP